MNSITALGVAAQHKLRVGTFGNGISYDFCPTKGLSAHAANLQ
jgi:hypothetical protein